MAHYCCDHMAFDLSQTCDQHPDRHDCSDAFIAELRSGYGLIPHDGGRSVIEIAYCPRCGTKLPPVGSLELLKR